MMRAKYLCRRRRCVWRNADGFCLMAHRCPTGDRFTTEGEGKEGGHVSEASKKARSHD